jgi:hypothetical protein
MMSPLRLECCSFQSYSSQLNITDLRNYYPRHWKSLDLGQFSCASQCHSNSLHKTIMWKGINALATPYDSSQITLICAIDQSSGRTGAVWFFVCNVECPCVRFCQTTDLTCQYPNVEHLHFLLQQEAFTAKKKVMHTIMKPKTSRSQTP